MINPEFAIEGLWQALAWETINPTEIFDQIAHRVRRHPRFKDMSITEIDLILADARREFEHDFAEFEWRLVRAFKQAIEFDESDGIAA
jgi:hypothetical protein